MSYIVDTYTFNKINLNEPDATKSILQNVAIILRSRLGTNIMYREFGISGKLLDTPQNIVMPQLHANIRETVERFEPRASVANVTFENDPNNPGKILPRVEVDIVDE